MIRSINELNKYLSCLEELSNTEVNLNNPCTINYLKSISHDSILSQLDPWLVVKDSTVLCTIMPLIENTVKGIQHELFVRYGIGLHHS